MMVRRRLPMRLTGTRVNEDGPGLAGRHPLSRRSCVGPASGQGGTEHPVEVLVLEHVDLIAPDSAGGNIDDPDRSVTLVLDGVE